MFRRVFINATAMAAFAIIVLPMSVLFAGEKDEAAGTLPGFQGKISDLKVVPNSQPSDITATKPAVQDMDLVGMARWATRALKNNPRPHLNYACRFGMSLLRNPPGPTHDAIDHVAVGDTENRIDWEFGNMKETCGDTSADEVAAGLRKRITGHLRDDGLCWGTYMARSGYPEYWDTVERFTHNYIREAQFFVTPDYAKLYRSLHPGEAGEKGLAMAREFEGGFQGAMGMSDRCFAGNAMDMMGCCFPEGMRSMYTAWSNTVRKEKDGVYVNMSFDCDMPEAKVTSFLPREGKIRVQAKTADDYRIRLSQWVPKDKVAVYRNGKPVTLAWQGSYAKFDNVAPGDVLTATYPLLSFVQKQKIKSGKGQPDREMTVTWLGNTVMKLEPRGPQLPLYENAPRPLPPLPKK